MSNLQKSLSLSSIVTSNKKIKLLDRKKLLTPKATQKAQVLQRAVICNRTLLNTKQIIQNHCLFLKVNKAQQKISSIKPLLAFCKNKCLKQLIGGNAIQNYKSIKKTNNKYEECTPCTPGIRSLPYL